MDKYDKAFEALNELIYDQTGKYVNSSYHQIIVILKDL